MKKVLSISLLFIFTVSTIGVVANSYTCTMMKMKTNECCDKTSKSCCTHEVKLLKVKDDFVSTAVQDAPKNFSSSIILTSPIISENYFQFSFSHFSERGHSPPGEPVDRLAFIQSFLI